MDDLVLFEGEALVLGERLSNINVVLVQGIGQGRLLALDLIGELIGRLLQQELNVLQSVGINQFVNVFLPQVHHLGLFNLSLKLGDFDILLVELIFHFLFFLNQNECVIYGKTISREVFFRLIKLASQNIQFFLINDLRVGLN